MTAATPRAVELRTWAVIIIGYAYGLLVASDPPWWVFCVLGGTLGWNVGNLTRWIRK